MIRGVIFDMDGVLIDAREWHYEALNEALALFGAEISRTEHEQFYDGLPTRKKLDELVRAERLAEHLVPVVSEVKQARTLRTAARHCFPKPEHIILLSELRRQGFALGIATNSIRQTSEWMLSYAGLLPLVDVLVTNEDVENAKPSPDIYLKTASALALPANQCLAVEDSQHGIIAAERAGAEVLQVENPDDVSLDLLLSVLERE